MLNIKTETSYEFYFSKKTSSPELILIDDGVGVIIKARNGTAGYMGKAEFIKEMNDVLARMCNEHVRM